MGIFEHFPYTNFHELNLDWLLKLTKENHEDIKALQEIAQPASIFVKTSGTIDQGDPGIVTGIDANVTPLQVYNMVGSNITPCLLSVKLGVNGTVLSCGHISVTRGGSKGIVYIAVQGYLYIDADNVSEFDAVISGGGGGWSAAVTRIS